MKKSGDSGDKHVRHAREDVAAAALAILDEYGLPDLTMRRLASNLDVQPSALYWHFDNKQTLLAHLADAIIARAVVLQPSSDDWAAAVRCEAESLRDVATPLPPQSPSRSVKRKSRVASAMARICSLSPSVVVSPGPRAWCAGGDNVGTHGPSRHQDTRRDTCFCPTWCLGALVANISYPRSLSIQSTRCAAIAAR